MTSKHAPHPGSGHHDERADDTPFWSVHVVDNIVFVNFLPDAITAGVDLQRVGKLWAFFDRLLAGPYRILHIDFSSGDLSHDGLVRLWEYLRGVAREQPQRANLELIRADVAMQRFIACVRDPRLFVVAAFQGEIDLNFFGLLLACDYLIMSDDSAIVHSRHPLGMGLGTAVPWFLKRTLTPGPLLDTLLTSETIPARHAYELGLVHRLTPPDSHAADALETTRWLASKGEKDLLALKRVLNASSAPLDQYLRVVGAALNRLPIGAPVCARCGYDLTGNTIGRCPECGQLFRDDIATAPDAPPRNP